MAELTIRYFAAAAEAAGTEQESVPSPGTVGALRALLVERFGAPMARVLGERVDVLPPFAGG